MNAKSKDEVIGDFMDSVREIAAYWARLPGKTDRERCDGVAFSMLTLIDGCSAMPGMDIVLRPHPDDKQFHKDNGEDWHEDGMAFNSDCHLHDRFHTTPITE